MDSFSKAAAERFPITMDFASDMESGDTISTQSVTAIKTSDNTDATATVIATPSISGSKIIVVVQAGTAGQTYVITFRATTAAGYIYDASVAMMVK